MVAGSSTLGTVQIVSLSGDVGSTFTPVDFLPDDRVVVNAYAVPNGAYAAGNAWLQYDNTGAGSGRSFVEFLETARMKPESDPPYVPPPSSNVSIVGA
jgi:hypothetical protein